MSTTILGIPSSGIDHKINHYGEQVHKVDDPSPPF